MPVGSWLETQVRALSRAGGGSQRAGLQGQGEREGTGQGKEGMRQEQGATLEPCGELSLSCPYNSGALSPKRPGGSSKDPELAGTQEQGGGGGDSFGIIVVVAGGPGEQESDTIEECSGRMVLAAQRQVPERNTLNSIPHHLACVQ